MDYQWTNDQMAIAIALDACQWFLIAYLMAREAMRGKE